MASTREVSYTMLKAESKTPRCVCVTACNPSILDNIFAFLLMYPHCFKVELSLLGELCIHYIRDKQGTVIRGRIDEVVDF